MEVVKKLLGVPKIKAVDLDLDVVKLGSAIVVRGEESLVASLGGIEQPVTPYDFFKLCILGDE